MLRCTVCNAVDYKDTIKYNRYMITIVNLILPFELDPDGPGATEPQKYPGYEPCLTTSATESAVLQNFTIAPSASIHQDTNKVRIDTIIHPLDNTYLSHVSTTNCVLDTKYPAMEPSPREYNNSIFGRRF